jgi:hypothetical protein
MTGKMLTVEARPAAEGWECAVDVAGSLHTVRVSSGDLRRWGRSGETPERLVTRAFEFLLQRESASQILRSFELADIQRYFPEFDREIGG